MSRPGDKFYKRARSQGYRSRAAPWNSFRPDPHKPVKPDSFPL